MKHALVLLLILGFKFSFAQTKTESQIDSLIAEIRIVVNENYVLSEKAKCILDSLKSHHYYEINSMDSLANQLNLDLFRFTNDKHLFIQFNPAVAENLLNKRDIHTEQNKKEAKENYGFDKPKILDGNIGYLKLNYFADATHAKRFVLKQFRHFNKTRALIIDIRSNLGGSGSMLQLLSGIFLPEDQGDILNIRYKSGRIVTLKSTEIDTVSKFLKQPIYILCDSLTFSAGEAFAFVMKNRGRAVVIGNTTAGAGNIAGPYAIHNHFILTVPVGVIVDPATGNGWEGTGVIPDLLIDSTKALDEALRLVLNKN